MDNLWILTEERPKLSVIKQIIDLYVKDFGGEYSKNEVLKIIPEIDNGIFKFIYDVTGITLRNIKNIYILTVSGSSSFFDFLVFKQQNKPESGSTDNLLMAIEETKTSDDESRNTGVYQRASKFVFMLILTMQNFICCIMMNLNVVKTKNLVIPVNLALICY